MVGTAWILRRAVPELHLPGFVVVTKEPLVVLEVFLRISSFPEIKNKFLVSLLSSPILSLVQCPFRFEQDVKSGCLIR
jgi:hypothetical protein